ncbi:KN motif and ankyrin repeat domain-containing protein 2 isoform X1 [Hemicordylus capensis]|uniref:KN motif and ankyrin repeat domain-containing protein 2 isoform X1 n=1 Tax=Hemicordylus capensis TaxID=884348 RepID=UPI00230271C9|nr:KN motif and ankyrin repeat domain-containing protein 2 isoform X1 [Hemicordylus capensis]XP_053147845.1 KN motif and ankyrin repeat domain-containing protein 2 isoform X1 [Hemicordylus capensis]XP_053147846.1 KN motif and ankyrin repeat domain-containing protein 2 isoform X1 [Hemicordylus capensis]XP_053147847.1 KN motif and ankyrin repeat domain-containing protein 2 isoform X1 [Hemicordylus capensis]
MAQVLHMETGFPGKASPASATAFHGKEQDLPYSVETPYGYRLDLDFLKYVDDIEKGHTIKRIPVHRRPRYSSLPRGYGYTGSWWTSTESLCSNASMDSRHSSYSYCGRSFYPQYTATPTNFSARVEKTLLDARKKLEDQAGSGDGERPRASGLGSLHSSVSGSTSSLVGSQCPSRQTSYNGSQQGAPGQFTPIGSGLSTPVSPTPGHLQHVREQMAVALKKLRQLEEQVKMIPVLQVKISVLQEEKRQLSVQLKSQKFLGHPGGFGKGKSRGELYIDIPEEGAGENKEKGSSMRPDTGGSRLDKKEVRSVGVGMSAEGREVGKCDVGVAVREEELGLPSPEEERQRQAIQALSAKIAVLETQLKRALQELQAAHQKLEGQGNEQEDKETSTGDGGLTLEWEVEGEGAEQWANRLSKRDIPIRVDTIKVVQMEREPEIVASTAVGVDHRPQRAQSLEESYASLKALASRDMGSEEAKMPLYATYRSDEVVETTFPVHAGPVTTAATFHSVKKISIVSTEQDGKEKQGTTEQTGSLEKTEPSIPESLQTEQVSSCLSQEPKLQSEEEDQASFTAEVQSTMKKKEEPAECLASKKSLQFVGVNGGYGSTSSEDSSTAENVSDNESTESEYHEASEGLPAAQATATEPPKPSGTATAASHPGIPTEGGKMPSAEGPSKEQAGNTGMGLSKELLSACEVLQKYLKSPDTHMDEEMKLAYTTVLHCWLRLSCHKDANPESVSQYMAAFQAFSPQLLEFIINMADANGNTALHYTVSHSNFPVVTQLLETGLCHVDQQNKAGYTAIMLTALAASRSESDMETIVQLLKMGNVNAKASQAGQTALMLAVSHGRLDMVRALLASEADVNLQDDDGSTALMCACEHGHADIVRLLLATPGCDVALSDNDGSTALSIALEAGQNDIAIMLYAHLNFAKSTSPGTPKQLRPENATAMSSDAQ